VQDPIRGLDTAVDDLKSVKLYFQHMINQWMSRQARRRPHWHMTERLELLGPVGGLSTAHKTTKQLVDRSIQCLSDGPCQTDRSSSWTTTMGQHL
jgi:hypothetical protein